MIKHVVSVSGGKDSLATLLIAIARFGLANIIAVFCDTGNEHETTYAYLDYLERRLGIKIIRLKASFDNEIAAKRMFIARDVRTRREYNRVPKTDRYGNPVYLKDKAGNIILFPDYDEEGRQIEVHPVQAMGWDAGRKVRWTNKAKRRALAVLHPTGNPFLDLCLWKGRFPSRKAQFCTEKLKRDMAVAFQLDLMEQGYTVVSWQGVRRDESENRRLAKQFEQIAPRMFIYRPIVDWTAQQTIDFAVLHEVESNPLYSQGMNRVGCMPCINVSKDELREIAIRFRGHIIRISEWEYLVGQASKRGFSTLFTDGHPAKDRREVFADLNVWTRVEWAKTTRGGRQFSLLTDLDEPNACSSAYGLCE